MGFIGSSTERRLTMDPSTVDQYNGDLPAVCLAIGCENLPPIVLS